VKTIKSLCSPLTACSLEHSWTYFTVFFIPIPILRKYFILFLVFLSFSVYGQNVSICSWNLQNFGRSKNDAELNYIAKVVKGFDIIAIQEVVAGYGGTQAVARLADELNRMGSKWDYVISDPTSGTPFKAERYAYLWKTAKVRKYSDAWLEATYAEHIDREPYYCRFVIGQKSFTLASFHAITKSKQPETEIKHFRSLPALYPNDNLIFCGDFNLPQSHSVFNPLRKMGYVSALVGQKTSLKMRSVNGLSLASEYDNFYFNAESLGVVSSGIIHFYEDFVDLKSARQISDHVPIYIQLSLNRAS